MGNFFYWITGKSDLKRLEILQRSPDVLRILKVNVNRWMQKWNQKKKYIFSKASKYLCSLNIMLTYQSEYNFHYFLYNQQIKIAYPTNNLIFAYNIQNALKTELEIIEITGSISTECCGCAFFILSFLVVGICDYLTKYLFYMFL